MWVEPSKNINIILSSTYCWAINVKLSGVHETNRIRVFAIRFDSGFRFTTTITNPLSSTIKNYNNILMSHGIDFREQYIGILLVKRVVRTIKTRAKNSGTYGLNVLETGRITVVYRNHMILYRYTRYIYTRICIYDNLHIIR